MYMYIAGTQIGIGDTRSLAPGDTCGALVQFGCYNVLCTFGIHIIHTKPKKSLRSSWDSNPGV